MTVTLRRGLEIMLWSGVMQVILLAAFGVGWILQGVTAPMSAVAKGSSPDRLREVDVFRAGLGALPFGLPNDSTDILSTAAFLPVSIPQDSKRDLELPDGPAAGEDILVRDDAPEPAELEESFDVAGPEGAEAQTMSPLLRIDRKSGKLEIGNFNTLTLTSSADQCLDMGYTLLDDAGASGNDLVVLAQSKTITMARICTSNGSVVITCRSNRMTISPRRLKPHESCES